MPRRLVLLLMSDLYAENLSTVIKRMEKGKKFGNREQIVARHIVDIPCAEPRDEPKPKPVKPPKATTKLTSKILKRKSTVKAAPPEPRYSSAEAVSGAFKKLARLYLPGDQIILVGMSGIFHDQRVIKDSMAELIKHLDAGTEPPTPPPQPNWRSGPVAPVREIFEFQQPPPNQLIGKPTAVSSVTMIHRTGADTQHSDYFDALLKQFPLTVRKLISINWATGLESTFHIVRDKSGNTTSREVMFFEELGWHANMFTYSTMNYIWYDPTATIMWAARLPSMVQTIPTSLLPASLKSGTSPPSTSWSGTTAISDAGATPAQSTTRMTESPRSSISSNDSDTTSRSASSSSSCSSATSIDEVCTTFTSEPSSSLPVVSSSKTESPPPSTSQVSSSTSSSPSSSSATTPCTSTESSAPSTSNAPQTTLTSAPQSRTPNNKLTLTAPTTLDDKPHGMEKHQLFRYSSYGARNANWHLPDMVVWRSSFSRVTVA